MPIRVHEEDTVLRATPRFPAFEDWTKMSEQQQDALLFRMETARRRKARLVWAAVVAGLAMTVYLGLAVWF